MPTGSTEATTDGVRGRSGTAGRTGRRRAILVLASAVLAPGFALGGSPSSADPNDAERIARGARIYAEACASCHGAQLEGQPDWRSPRSDGTYPAPPHDAEGHTWHHPDSLLFRYVKLGGAEALQDVPGFRSGMPGLGGMLSDQEIWDVLAFIKSHWPEEMQEYQRTVTENERGD